MVQMRSSGRFAKVNKKLIFPYRQAMQWKIHWMCCFHSQNSHVFILFYAAPVDETILGIKSEWIVVIAICTLLIFLACGFSVGICICRRRLRNISGKAAAATTTSIYSNSNQQPEVNGLKHLNFYRPAVGEWNLRVLNNRRNIVLEAWEYESTTRHS